MFTTTNAKKIYVPIELRAKLYTYGNNSPRARRCVTSVRQLVHHGGGKEVDTKTACLAVMIPESTVSIGRSGIFPTLEDIIAKNKSK